MLRSSCCGGQMAGGFRGRQDCEGAAGDLQPIYAGIRKSARLFRWSRTGALGYLECLRRADDESLRIICWSAWMWQNGAPYLSRQRGVSARMGSGQRFGNFGYARRYCPAHRGVGFAPHCGLVRKTPHGREHSGYRRSDLGREKQHESELAHPHEQPFGASRRSGYWPADNR